MERERVVLGAGVTGLAAARASGAAVFEAEEHPGGICSSYYVRPGSEERLHEAPADGEAYRFEIGGGHWIFGGDPLVWQLLRRLVRLRRYERRSAVYLPDRGQLVPYPLQNHLAELGAERAAQALAEMARPAPAPVTMKEWLEGSFGPTLCELFFFPFHELYTAGLYETVAPQDPYKSPVQLDAAARGALGRAGAAGYNVSFRYPEEGLDALSRRLGEGCELHFGRRAERIDPERREVRFADGSRVAYGSLLSTLPLHHALAMAGLEVEGEPEPCTSVVVLNLGARRGPRCPDAHWLYVPRSRAGFHRIGFYSNVDAAFLPRRGGERVALYVERASLGRPGEEAVEKYVRDTVEELQDWGFIGEVEVADATFIDVAYTWRWPGSTWRERALARLEEAGIFPVGRYGRWIFQGIADSIRDGLFAGAALREGPGAARGGSGGGPGPSPSGA